jgi:hypothetical protein
MLSEMAVESLEAAGSLEVAVVEGGVVGEEEGEVGRADRAWRSPVLPRRVHRHLTPTPISRYQTCSSFTLGGGETGLIEEWVLRAGSAGSEDVLEMGGLDAEALEDAFVEEAVSV